MKKIVFALFLLTVLPACHTPKMAVSEDLSFAQEYIVTGKQGWLLKQKIAFGPYQTSRVKRGWTSSYNIPFFVHFKGSREKFRFTQYFGSDSLVVHAVNRIKLNEFPVHHMFAIPLKQQDFFAVDIFNPANGERYQMYIENPNQQNIFLSVRGHLIFGEEIFTIQPVMRQQNGRGTMMHILGYEILKGGKAVASVETINRGAVRIAADLPDDKRRVLAAVASSLLLFNQLEHLE